ncbi:MAG: caspase family protein, partial [Candidatus Aminicenantaceae bacterium]
MSKRVYLIIILLIPIFCIFLFGQRGMKINVKTSEGSSLELYKQYRALIIGVSDYLYWPRLPNAVKDAREVAAILRERGFITRVLE